MPKGYTLIELLVVVTIIATISVMVFANYRGFSKDQVLIKATGQIQSLIKLAQSNASSGLKCASGDSESSSEWYVKFKPVTNNKSVLELSCYKSAGISPASNTIMQTLTLDQNIFVTKVNNDTGSCLSSDGPSLTLSNGGTFIVSFKTISGEVKFFLNRNTPLDSPICELNTLNTEKIPVVIEHNKDGVVAECSESVTCKTLNINRGGVVDAGQ